MDGCHATPEARPLVPDRPHADSAARSRRGCRRPGVILWTVIGLPRTAPGERWSSVARRWTSPCDEGPAHGTNRVRPVPGSRLGSTPGHRLGVWRLQAGRVARGTGAPALGGPYARAWRWFD